MSRWTIVPIRGLASGKTRLAGLLDSDGRAALNAALLQRVLGAVAAADGGLQRCIVAAGAEDAARVGRSCGARVLLANDRLGLNGTLQVAREMAIACGATEVLALVADLPQVSGAALRRLLDALPAGGAALIADKEGVGTTGLLLPATCPLPYMFGPDSLQRHRGGLLACGLDPLVWSDPALSFDLDSPHDYACWRALSQPRAAACITH
jgi:2-phospho-L-lactate/phosphoenolpyruvate guanylyltransferase